MPFTPTHALAVLPVVRWLPLSALVVGSLIPDLPLYFDFGVGYDTTHSFVGLLTACVPLGVAAWILFHVLVKRPVYELLPDGVRERLAAVVTQRPRLDAVAWAAVVAAVWFGALTHVVWDAFTHEGRWGVEAVAFLDASVSIGGVAVPGYAVFQHGASLVGLPLLAWLIARAIRRQAPVPVSAGMSAGWRVGIAAVLLALPTLAGFEAVARAGIGPIGLELFRLVTVAGAWFAVLVLVYGAAYTVGRRLVAGR